MSGSRVSALVCGGGGGGRAKAQRRGCENAGGLGVTLERTQRSGDLLGSMATTLAAAVRVGSTCSSGAACFQECRDEVVRDRALLKDVSSY